MSAEIITLDMQTTLDIPVERVIAGATDAALSEVIVLGTTEAGEFYFAASSASAPSILWLLERGKHDLLGQE